MGYCHSEPRPTRRALQLGIARGRWIRQAGAIERLSRYDLTAYRQSRGLISLVALDHGTRKSTASHRNEPRVERLRSHLLASRETLECALETLRTQASTTSRAIRQDAGFETCSKVALIRSHSSAAIVSDAWRASDAGVRVGSMSPGAVASEMNWKWSRLASVSQIRTPAILKASLSLSFARRRSRLVRVSRVMSRMVPTTLTTCPFSTSASRTT